MTLVRTFPKFNIELLTFPGGEPHCKIQDYNYIYNANITIYFRITSFNCLGELLAITDAIKRCKPNSIKLVLPYFPGSRQDRVANRGEPFTCKIYSDIINSLEFNQVQIYDPHSDVTTALLKNVEILPVKNFIRQAIRDFGPTTIISPDAGASKKIHSLGLNITIVQCGKVRDTVTGKLSGFEVHGDVVNKHCLIIDDICDGGGTFVGLGKELIKKGALSVGLYVTHGIFSKGTNLEPVSSIYTTNSFSDVLSGVVVYDLFKQEHYSIGDYLK